MPSWRDEYLDALKLRDKREQKDRTFYESYTKLADRTSALQAASATEALVRQDAPTPTPKYKEQKLSNEKGVPHKPGSEDFVAKVRQDLAEAQRSRSVMEAKLQSLSEELQKLKTQSTSDTKRINELSKEGARLNTGLRDREEELKAKTKLIEARTYNDVHDETVSLTLQLNMAEGESQKLRRENKDLVDRWMARMGQEADAMNNESKFS